VGQKYNLLVLGAKRNKKYKEQKPSNKQQETKTK
jgi:hypothetical protein